MPELPEVETIVRQLCARGVEGRRIESVRVDWPRTIEPLSPAVFSERIVGASLDALERVGKWMLFALSTGETILVHLRMSGSFSLTPGPYDRLVLMLSGGLVLYYADPRKFGRWRLVDDPGVVLDALGPDALSSEFTCAGFRVAMRRHRRMTKPLLLDQSVVAGLGNIYADEALWEAQIHPETRSDMLTDMALDRLYVAIVKVLRNGVENRGTSLGAGRSNYRDVEGVAGANREEVKVYGRAGQSCPRCGAVLKKSVVAQRGTTHCPGCQPR